MAKSGGTTRSSTSRNPRGLSAGRSLSVNDAKTSVFMNIEMARGASQINAFRTASNRAADNRINTTYFNSNESFQTNGDRFEIRSRSFRRSEALSRTVANLERTGRGGDVAYSRNALGESFRTIMSGSLSSETDEKKAIDYIKKRAK